MRSYQIDVAFGLGLVAIGAAVDVSLWPRQGLNEAFLESSGFLPVVICTALVLSGLCLAAGACRYLRTNERLSIGNPFLLVAVIAVSAGYTLLLPVLGYAIATIGFVLCVVLLLGIRSWRIIVFLPILLSLGLYILIGVLAGLPLPSGRIL